MSQEIRRRGSKEYVTQTIREGSRVIKKHIGSLADPVVQLWYRSRELQDAEYKASIEQLDREKLLAASLEQAMNFLADFASSWQSCGILFERFEFPDLETKVTKKSTSDDRAPLSDSGHKIGVRAVSKLCEFADAGDESARDHLDKLMADSRMLHLNALRPLETAKTLVIRSLSGDAYIAAKGIEKQLDEKVQAIMESASPDPISQMYAEITAIAQCDVVRCQIAAMRDMSRKADISRAQKRADGALRRFTRIASAMKKHMSNVS